MKNKSYLILGASSYLGFQMYKFLQKKNEKVTGTYYSAESNNENFEKMSKLHNPYGDGLASKRIVDFIKNR